MRTGLPNSTRHASPSRRKGVAYASLPRLRATTPNSSSIFSDTSTGNDPSANGASVRWSSGNSFSWNSSRVGPTRFCDGSERSSQAVSASSPAAAATNASITSRPGSAGVVGVACLSSAPQAARTSVTRTTTGTALGTRGILARGDCRPRLVQLGVDGAGRLLRQAGHALELLLRGGEYPVDRAEVHEQRPPPGRPDAAQLVEQRLAGLRGPLLPVVADGESVSLVAEPLEELQPGRRALEHDRPPLPGNEHMLLPLGERDDRDARQLVLVDGAERGRQLPFPPVDDDEIRDAAERLVPVRGARRHARAREPARQHLRQGRVVVLPAGGPPDGELPVERLPRLGILEHHHRAHRLGALRRRDVEALD